MAKATPWTSSRSFYGNWGGPGNRGGPPIDPMDEGVRRHDIIYQEARTGRILRTADHDLRNWLAAIDEESMDESGRAFRCRSIAFLESFWAELVGKPFLSKLRRVEPDWACFRTPEDVRAFFDPVNPAFPERQRRSAER